MGWFSCVGNALRIPNTWAIGEVDAGDCYFCHLLGGIHVYTFSEDLSVMGVLAVIELALVKSFKKIFLVLLGYFSKRIVQHSSYVQWTTTATFALSPHFSIF